MWGREDKLGGKQTLNIGFVLDVYPTISTFILNQVSGMLNAGNNVYLFPIQSGDPKLPSFHDPRLKGKVFFFTKYETGRFKKYKKVCNILWRHLFNDCRPIISALNFFKYGRNALNFSLLFEVSPFLGTHLDIVQVHFGDLADRPIKLLELGFKFKMFTMFHGYDIRKGIDEGSYIYANVFKYSEAILSISAYNTSHLKEFGCPENKIIYHPVGIDPGHFKCVKHQNKKFRQKIEILSVGRLVWEKGYKYAIEAMQLLKEQGVQFHYTIIGEGYLRKELTQQLREFNLTQHVDLIGAKNTDEVLLQMCSADIYLLASEAEALPVALMEASACELAVVATDVGSVAEEVIDGETGLLVPPKNSKAIFDSIVYLYNHRDRWKEFGSCARSYIEGKFDINILNRKLLKIYHSYL